MSWYAGTVCYNRAGTAQLESAQGLSGNLNSQLYAWSTSLLQPVMLSVDGSGNLNVSGSGGGGGGPVTIADGADVTQGAMADAAYTSGAGTVISLLKGIFARLVNAGTPTVSGTVAVSNFPATQPVSGTFWQVTQPISGSISFTAPQHVIVDSSAAIAVTGPLTDTQLRASAVPISAATLPLPTNAATSALQTTGNTSLASILTNLGTPFQAGGNIGNTSFGISGTLPAFAATPTFNLGTLNGAATTSKQDSIIAALGSPLQAGGTVSVANFPLGFLSAQSGVWTVGLSATDSTNLATTAAQTTAAATSLTAIDLGIPAALGAAATAASMPVNIASDQTVPVSAAALPLPSNAAQENNGALAAINYQQRILAQQGRRMQAMMAAQLGQFVPVPEFPEFLY